MEVRQRLERRYTAAAAFAANIRSQWKAWLAYRRAQRKARGCAAGRCRAVAARSLDQSSRLSESGKVTGCESESRVAMGARRIRPRRTHHNAGEGDRCIDYRARQ